MWLHKVYPKPILGLEKLNNHTQLALGQSLLILEVSVFSNSTSQTNAFILSSKVIENYMGSEFCVSVSANGIAKQSFYRGEVCIEKLVDTLRDWLFWCYKGKQLFRRLRISTQQREQMLKMTNVLCCICGKAVETRDKPTRVIHHCHLCDTIIGLAHSNSNLRARTKNFLPVFFHHLSRYDAHHILKQLKLKANEELSAIAKTDETFISFSIKTAVGPYKKQCGQLVKLHESLRFMDNYQFFSQSLENFAKTLKANDFSILKHFFPTFLIIRLSNSHRKVSFRTAISTVLKNSKNRFLLKVTLGKTVSLAQMTLLQLTINMHWIFTKSLAAGIRETTTTFIWKLMCFCRQIFLKNSETYAGKFTRSIRLTSTQLPIWVGRLCSFWLMWNWDFNRTLICCFFWT